MSETENVKVEVSKPVDRPKVVATWDGQRWVIDCKDEDGKKEITPRHRNLLLKDLSRILRQRYRKFRVRARMAEVQKSTPSV